MGKTAFVFPGQGSQIVSMGKDIYEHSSSAAEVFDRADVVLGQCISITCFEDPDKDLDQTKNTQPAILTNSIATLEAFKEYSKLTPDYVAGHSLGEYTALYASWVLDLDDVLKIVQKRGQLMGTAKEGSMAAILGLPIDIIEGCIREARKKGIVSIANYNTPAQTVITGELEPLQYAATILKEAGAKKIIPLNVSGAFHSELMKDFAQELSETIGKYDVNDANCPVITNIDAQETTTAEDFKEKMLQQMFSPVKWYQSVNTMINNDVDTFVEFGSGKVLTSMIKKIDPTVKVYNVFDMDSIKDVANLLN